jgi:DNA-binding transcriptional LysR family regulator
MGKLFVHIDREGVPFGEKVAFLSEPSSYGAPVEEVYAFWRTDASRRPAIRAGVRALREAAADYDTRPVPV